MSNVLRATLFLINQEKMFLPQDVVNLITEYYVSMQMFELRQRLHAEFLKNHVMFHLKSFHETTLTDGVFNPTFCLAVLNYMNLHNMNI